MTQQPPISGQTPSPAEHDGHSHSAAHDHGHVHGQDHDGHEHAGAPGDSHDHAHDDAHHHAHTHGGHHDHHAHGGHDHAGHHHGARGYVKMQKALAVGIVLNLAFVIFEVFAAKRSGSLALYSDAAHNMGDLVSLIFAWGATLLARRQPSTRFTYGLRGGTILAALANGILLLVAGFAIGYEAIVRFSHPMPVVGGIVAIVALVGVITNGVSALFLMRHRHDDLNARGAFLHLASDAVISVAVIVAGVLVRITGLAVIDTAMSLALAVLILVSTFRLLAESLRLVLQGVPESIDCDAVETFLLDQPGVAAAHDLHIWAMSTAENAMTAHLVMPAGHPGDRFIANLAHQLDERFKLGHVTLQVETEGGCSACQLGLSVA